MIKILFVCTGNICRSPSAEAIFRHLVADAGLSHEFVADSVGLHGFHVGEPPDARAVAAAARRGYEMQTLRARRMQREDFDRFDLLLAMDDGHLSSLHSQCPPNRADRISLFLSVAPGCGETDVPDPFYGTMEDFEQSLDLIEIGAREWLAHFQRQLAL